MWRHSVLPNTKFRTQLALYEPEHMDRWFMSSWTSQHIIMSRCLNPALQKHADLGLSHKIFTVNFCHKNAPHTWESQRKYILMSMLPPYFYSLGKHYSFQEMLDKSRNMFLPFTSDLKMNCWSSWNVFSLTCLGLCMAASPMVCRWRRKCSLSHTFVELGWNVSCRYICDRWKIKISF